MATGRGRNDRRAAGAHPWAAPWDGLLARAFRTLENFTSARQLETAAREIGALDDADLWAVMTSTDGDPDRLETNATAGLLLGRRWRLEHAMPEPFGSKTVWRNRR